MRWIWDQPAWRAGADAWPVGARASDTHTHTHKSHARMSSAVSSQAAIEFKTINNGAMLGERAPLLHAAAPSGAPDAGEGGSSFIGCVFSLANSAVGAGVLAIPFAVRSAGIGFALVMFGFVAATTMYSLHLFGEATLAARQLGHKIVGYEDVAFAAGGWRLRALAKTQITYSAVGAIIAFLIILSQIALAVAELWAPPGSSAARSVWASRGFLTGALTLFVILPLSLLRNLGAFRFATVLALASIGYISGALVVYSLSPSAPGAANGPLVYFAWSTDLCYALPTMIFAFGCHSVVPAIVFEMRSPSLRRFDGVAALAMLACLVFYGTVGMAGYASFRAETQGDILQNFSSHNLAVGVLGRTGMAFTLCFTLPIIVWPCRYALDTALFAGAPFSWVRHGSITVLLLGVSLLIAVLFPRVTIVFALSGSTGAVVNEFIFPAVFWLRLVAPGSHVSTMQRAGAYALIAYGLCAGLVCTTVILYKEFAS